MWKLAHAAGPEARLNHTMGEPTRLAMHELSDFASCSSRMKLCRQAKGPRGRVVTRRTCFWGSPAKKDQIPDQFDEESWPKKFWCWRVANLLQFRYGSPLDVDDVMEGGWDTLLLAP